MSTCYCLEDSGPARKINSIILSAVLPTSLYTLCFTASASWWLFHPFCTGDKQWWCYFHKWSRESWKTGFGAGSEKQLYNDETTSWQIVCWSQVCTASTWECYSNTPSWCQLASLPRGHLTKHAINSRSTEMLTNNKREIKIGGFRFWFSASESNICFPLCDPQQSSHWNEHVNAALKAVVLTFSPKFQQSLTQNVTSDYQLKNEYELIYQWNGMQKKEIGGFYLNLVVPVLF